MMHERYSKNKQKKKANLSVFNDRQTSVAMYHLIRLVKKFVVNTNIDYIPEGAR